VKVTAQEIEQRQMVLEIEVEDERMQRALDQAYKRIASRINVPGFRRGRAPRPLVERMVGREAIVEDAVDKLVPEVYRDALKEQDISPAGQPSVEVTSTEPLQFKATLPLQPKVELGDYRSIDIRPDPVVVEQQEVDDFIQRMREAHLTWVPVERAAQIGDRIGMSVEARRGEQPAMNNQDVEFIVDPDGAEPAKGFSEQLVGLEAGQEKTFSLGGDEEGSEPTEFTVKVQWVKEKELPALDDEFAALVSDKETVDQLVEEVRGHLTSTKEHQVQERHREALVQAAVDQAQVEIPPQMINRQAAIAVNNLASTLQRQGLSIDQYLQYTERDEGAFRAEMLADAERSMKRSLVLESLGEAESLEVGADEIEIEIQTAVQNAKDPARAAREALASSDARGHIEQIIRSRKAIERLVEISGGASRESETPAVAATASGDTE
jgi:trigger factor